MLARQFEAVPRAVVRRWTNRPPALVATRPAVSSRRSLHASTLRAPRRPLAIADSCPCSLVSVWSSSSVTAPAATSLIGRRTIFIQTEATPNSDAIKFLPNHRILPEDLPTPFIEYLNPRSTISPPYPSPLAAQLMNIDGVKSVFYGADFITVTKDADARWAHIRPEVFALITEAVTAGLKIVNVAERKEDGSYVGAEGDGAVDSLAYDENDTEVVGMIKELLATRIRPAIQEDGGDIDFRGFENGNVLLKLRGACRTCDSSTVTLKNGIEGMLMHYIEEVKGVVQVMDDEEEIALKEFAKFEEKLKKQKGLVPPTSTGAGSIDTVPG